jgi:hypothetical protein
MIGGQQSLLEVEIFQEVFEELAIPDRGRALFERGQ